MVSKLYTGRARDLYRAMRKDGETPEVGPNQLGVRTKGTKIDLTPDVDGTVQPDTGGMSVIPDDPNDLPYHRRPISLEGSSTWPVWVISSPDIVSPLAIRPTDPKHWLIAPSRPMTLEKFRSDPCRHGSPMAGV